MNKNEECKRTVQLDPESRNLVGLKAVSDRLGEVSEALNQCQLLTNKLIQAVDGIAKSYAILHVERVDEQLHNKHE